VQRHVVDAGLAAAGGNVHSRHACAGLLRKSRPDAKASGQRKANGNGRTAQACRWEKVAFHFACYGWANLVIIMQFECMTQ
jgi:hypothetical protein